MIFVHQLVLNFEGRANLKTIQETVFISIMVACD